MDKEFIIRLACKRDFDAVHTLTEQTHTLHLENRPDIYQNVDPLTRDAFYKLLIDADVRMLVAERDGIVAGLCLLLLKSPMNRVSILRPRMVAWIDMICVHPDYRRQGLGSALYESACRYASEEGADSVELMVWSFNHCAFSFYESLGMRLKSITMEQKLEKGVHL